MTDDIVTRLRNAFTTKDYPMLKDHCESCAIPKEWGGHHDNCLYDHAAYEIERLRADRDRWVKWGEHVFTCPNKGLNPCRDCVSPATADAMSRVDNGEAWNV